MTTPFGLNCLSSGGIDAYTSVVNPAVMFFMDDLAAAAAYQRQHPDTIVIHRVYNPNEAVLHRTAGATLAYLQARANEVAVWDKRIYINLSCEPDVSRDDDLHKLVAEQLIALRWAKQHGYRVAALHLAHYGLDERHWPILEPISTYIAENSNLFLFTCDEYGAGTMFSGVLDPSLPGGNEAGHIQPETWKKSPVPMYYHCGRITNFFRWLKANHKPLPPTVITEHGLDALGDVTAWRNSLIKTPGYTDARGWRSLRNQHQAWYGARGWTPERAYGEMIKALYREVYAEWANIKGVCIYCWGGNGDPQWMQFDIQHAPELYQVLATYQAPQTGEPPVTVTPVPKPANAGAGVLARMKTGYNLRNAPGTASVVLRAVAPNEIVTYYPNQPDKPQANGFTWVWVETDNGAGWMALQTQFARLIPDGWPTDKEVALGVPFVSQLNTGESNNCGEAALTAVLNYAGNVTGKPTLKALPVADVVATVGNNGGFASMGDLVNAAKHYGVTARAVAFQTLDSLRAELDAGRPVIALVERGKIPGATAVNAFTGAHFVTITGYDDRVMTILDPLKPAATDGMLRVYPAELLEAWRSTPGNSGNFQAVYFDASAFVPAVNPPEPEPPPLESVFLTLDEFKQDLTAKKQQRDALQMQLDAVNKQIAIMEAALARAQQPPAEQQQAA